MKKISVTVAAAIMIIGTSASCEKESVLPETSMPEKVKTYIATHFSDHKVIQYVKDKDGLELTHDVNLDKGLFLEFNRSEEIIEIDGSAKLPNSVIPEKILTYVTTNYPDNFITDWELDDRNQQVELNSGLTLEFTMSGDFLRIDS